MMTSVFGSRRPVPLEEYLAFLPPDRRESAVPPVSDWWDWREHRVHLLRSSAPEAPVRVLLVHGAGAHGEALWPVAAQLLPLGVDVTAVDLPGYGRARSPHPSRVRYEDWIALLVDLVSVEDDGRPVLLLGGSIGGLLAAEVAGIVPGVSVVAATCLLDPRQRAARRRMTRWGRAGLPAMALLPLVRGPLARLPLRISWVAHLSRMGRDPALGALCAADSRGGGATVPLGLMVSYLQHDHTAARASAVPITLVHPEKDDWTPLALSSATLATLPGARDTVVLRECGHFPLEEPELTDLVEAVRTILGTLPPGRGDQPLAGT